MNADVTGPRLRIGISGIGSAPGLLGGLDVYVRQLVEALARYETRHTYMILVMENRFADWQYRTWPAHIQFVALADSEPVQSVPVRLERRARRFLGKPLPPTKGEDYVVRQIDALKLDVIHYTGTFIRPLGVQTPCILGFWDMQHEYYPQFFTENELQFRAKMYRPSVEKAVHVIASSSYTRDTLIEKYRVADDKMTIIPHGIFPVPARSVPEEIARVRARYRLPESYIYYPANPWPHKNHARLMAALRLYAQRHGTAPNLVVSGRLKYEVRSVADLAVAAGVEALVTDIGFVPAEDIMALYRGASLLVFPSLFEGFGIPLIEAMAAGCPIAAANATAIPECVGPAALLFDPFDTGAMADAIHRLLTDETLRRDLVARGFEQVKRYAWSDVVTRVVDVYETVGRRLRQGTGPTLS